MAHDFSKIDAVSSTLDHDARECMSEVVESDLRLCALNPADASAGSKPRLTTLRAFNDVPLLEANTQSPSCECSDASLCLVSTEIIDGAAGTRRTDLGVFGSTSLPFRDN